MFRTFVCVLMATLVGLTGTALAVPPCAECPPGCIPSDFVESYKQPAVEVPRVCPPGCAGLEAVKVLRDQPGCAIGVAVPKAAPLVGEIRNVGSTRMRNIFFPTALNAPPGDLSFTGYAAGLWDIEYTLSDNLQLGGYAVLPVYVAGAFPSIKASFALNENLSLGFGGFVGLAGPYAGDISGSYVFVAAGHVEATVHKGPHAFTAGLAVVGAGMRDSGEDLEMVEGAILLPNLGYRWAFHRNWSFQVELTGPLVVGEDGILNEEAIVVMIYGFRGHGETMFGDIGAVLPIFSVYVEDVWKYTPIGVPYFSLGFRF